MSLYTKIKLFSKLRSVMDVISSIPSTGEPLFYSDCGSLKFGNDIDTPTNRDFIRTEAIQNHVLNSDFFVATRGTSFTSATTPANNDDTYLFDRWNLVSDGNDIIDVDQDILSGKTWCKSVVQTPNKQFGFVYIFSAEETNYLKNKKVSVSFKANTTTAKIINNLKASVLAWTGTADTVTSDVVATWGATPTWATNWTAENTPTNITITTTSATYYIEGITLDTVDTNNLALIIWVNDVDAAAGDELFLTDIMFNIERGSFPYRPYFRNRQHEVQLCQEYFFSINDFTTCPSLSTIYGSADTLYCNILLPFPIRRTPTITMGNVTHYTPYTTAAAVAIGTPTIGSIAIKGSTGVYFVISDTGKFTANEKYQLYASGQNGKLTFSMEL